MTKTNIKINDKQYELQPKKYYLSHEKSNIYVKQKQKITTKIFKPRKKLNQQPIQTLIIINPHLWNSML